MQSDAITPPTTEQRLKAIEDRLDHGSERMKLIDESLAKNTAITESIHELMVAARAGFKVAGWIGVAAGWVAKLAGAVAAVWGAIYIVMHGGQPPK